MGVSLLPLSKSAREDSRSPLDPWTRMVRMMSPSAPTFLLSW